MILVLSFILRSIYRFDDTVKGGFTRFLDMFGVLEKFREEHPDEFNTLCRVPVTFKMEYENR